MLLKNLPQDFIKEKSIFFPDINKSQKIPYFADMKKSQRFQTWINLEISHGARMLGLI